MSGLYTKISKNKKAKYYLIYTLAFVLCCGLIMSYFLMSGKTFINFVDDGLYQHYQSQIYLSRYIRRFFSDLIHQHKLIIPQWDFSLGEGSDITSSLHSDIIGDPITALVAFFPDQYVYLYYELSILLKIYLSGFFFSELCFYTKKENIYAVLSGALVYDFCYYSIINLIGHNYFFTPMMYLPLIILGVEKIINDDKPYLLSAAVCLAAVSQFYFFFMVVMLTVIYVFVRLLVKYRSDIKTMFRKVIRIFVFSLLGLLMGGIIVFPMVYTYLSDVRMGIKIEHGILYDRFYYERLLTIYLSNDNTYDLCLGFAGPTLLTMLMLFRRPKKNLTLCILAIIAAVCVCVPFCGKVLNGFRFVSSRWCFGISLLVAYSLVHEWDEIGKDQTYLLIMSFFIFCFACISSWSRVDRVLVPLCITSFFLMVSCMKKKEIRSGLDLRQLCMLGLIVLNIFYIIDYDFSYRGSNRLRFAMDREDVLQYPISTETYVYKNFADQADPDSFYRYSGENLIPNNAMLYDTHSTDYYWSITNSYDQQFRNDIDLTNRCSWMIKGYELRSQLETLANVRYYIKPESSITDVPYGFDLVERSGDYDIYENSYALPFGYTFKKTLSLESWLKLNAVEKQEALLQAVVLDETQDSNGIISDAKEISYTASPNENASFSDHEIIIEKEGASITFSFEGLENCENYFIMEGLDHEDIYSVVEDDHTENMMLLNSSAGKERIIYYLTKNHHYYYGKKNYAVMVGYEGKPLTQITISFSLPGKYHFDHISIVCLPMEKYGNYIDSLSEETLKNVVFDPNRISGDISVSEDKYLLLSVPYSKGWKAYVDSKQVDLLQADEHYMAIFLEKGNHQIELKYSTPLLKAGAIVSFVSCCAFLALIIFKRKDPGKKTL